MKNPYLVIIQIAWFAAIGDSRTISIPYVTGKISGITEISTGYRDTDSILFGSKISFSTYKAFSILTVCGAGGELGIKTDTSKKYLYVRSINDTDWSGSNKLPTDLVPLGTVPSDSWYKIEQIGEEKFNGFAYAGLGFKTFAGECGGTPDYIFSAGYNRIFYGVTDRYTVKLQIGKGEESINYSNYPFITGKNLLTIKIKYVISDDKSDLKENPSSITKKAIRVNISNTMLLGKYKVNGAKALSSAHVM